VIIERVQRTRTRDADPAAYRVYLWGATAEGIWDGTSDEYELTGGDLCSAYSWAIERSELTRSVFTLYAVLRDTRATVALISLGGHDPAPDEMDDALEPLELDLGLDHDLLAVIPTTPPLVASPVDPRDARSIDVPSKYLLSLPQPETLEIREANAIEILRWATQHHGHHGFSLSLQAESVSKHLTHLTTRPPTPRNHTSTTDAG
jgi:hypothetical protein